MMDGDDGAFVFTSRQNPGLFAVTRDSTGANLPPAYGPWRKTERHPLNLHAPALGEKGFCLCRPDGMAW
jgi:hypothetical protein